MMHAATADKKPGRIRLLAAGALVLALAGLWWAAAVSQAAGGETPGEQRDEARRIIVYTTTNVI